MFLSKFYISHEDIYHSHLLHRNCQNKQKQAEVEGVPFTSLVTVRVSKVDMG